FLSATGSAELIKSAASGPRISFRATTSNTPAARLRVSAASFAELNSFCFFESDFATGSDFFSEAACKNNPGDPTAKIVTTITEIREDLLTAGFLLIVFFDRVPFHLRRPPPPPPPRAPPPLAPAPPKLVFPRLLLARTALPLNAALPKALTFEAKPGACETPRLPIRSPPTPLWRIAAFPPVPTPVEKPVVPAPRFIPALLAPRALALKDRLIPAPG